MSSDDTTVRIRRETIHRAVAQAAWGLVASLPDYILDVLHDYYSVDQLGDLFKEELEKII